MYSKSNNTNRQSSIKAGSWVLFGHLCSQIIRFGGNLVLTRLLVPEMFGVMAIVNVFVLGVHMLSDLGLGQSIIQNKRGEDPLFINTAWTLQILRGGAVWLFICLLALALILMNLSGDIGAQKIYADPILPWLLVTVGFSSVISGFTSTSIYQANRSLNLGRLTVISLLAQTAGLITIIVVAWIARTIWALAIGVLVSSFIEMLLSHLILLGVKNKFCWDKQSLNSLINFGKWIFLSTAIGFVGNQGDRLILGGFLSPATMGIYSIAFMLSSLPHSIVSMLSHKILFPIFSDIYRGNPSEAKEKLIKFKLWLNICIMPIIGLLIAFGQTIIDILYDDRFTEAGWMMQLLLLRAVISCILTPDAIVLMAKGFPQYATFSAACKAIFLMVALPFSFSYFGLEMMVLVSSLSGIVDIPILWFGIIKHKLFDLRSELFPLLVLFLGYVLGVILLSVIPEESLTIISLP